MDYEELPSVTDLAQAHRADTPLVWEAARQNLCFDWETGDKTETDRLFKEAAHVTKLTVVNNRIVVASVEARAAVAEYDAASNRFTLHANTQGSWQLKDMLAKFVFNLPPEQFRVITPDVGGGFGMKLFLYPEHVMVCFAARAPPAGFTRMPAESGSFAHWLRGLPMKPEGAEVLTHTGKPKWRQDVHTDVIDIDVGERDLQQCADAIMRLRAEWLYSARRDKEIAFNDTKGKRLIFVNRAKRTDYPGLRRYLNYVFAYAGTYSLERELKPVAIEDMKIGDVFIRGGFPGHAVLVADMAENRDTGEKRFLLVQSYMPAQDIHVLKNPAAEDGSPWYSTEIGETLVTPEWTFPRGQLRRWP